MITRTGTNNTFFQLLGRQESSSYCKHRVIYKNEQPADLPFSKKYCIDIFLKGYDCNVSGVLFTTFFSRSAAS